MEDADIKKIIMEKQANNKIACKTAVEIADQAGIPKRKVGEMIDELKIKIVACQLGCFD